MDLLKLEERITKLIVSEQFDLAEAELQQAKLQATQEADSYALEEVLSSLATLYRVKEPPDLAKAESCSLELERVSGTGYAKVQTAMMLYWSMHDLERTVTKAREGITAATAEQDDKTVYQGLSLLGLALLDLHQDDEAVRVLGEIESMVAARLRIVVGDETLFLERLFEQTKAEKTRNAIQEIARILWPVCREAAFADRLKTLANASLT
jgi:hypothetical protein